MTARELRVDATVSGHPSTVLREARRAEELGLHRLVVSETAYSPFPQLARAADATSAIELATGVAIAFARTPMALAYEAWGVHAASGGRAVIGLGSQVKTHIQKRFGMPWSEPAARMREYVAAVRAIWHSWQTGDRLRFRGDFYTHTAMTPVFAPDPVPGAAPPPLLLAGVGPLMTAAAGAVADGFIAHPFTTADHLAQQVLPGVRAARAVAEAAGEPWTRERPFEVVGSLLAAVGRTEQELAEARTAVRERLAFYASTPGYRPVLDAQGWGALGDELHTLSLRGRWKEMGELIDDRIFDAFAVSGTPAEVAAEARRRYAGRVDRLGLHGPEGADPEPLLQATALIAAAGGSVS